jgi:hypothetical protein
MGKVPVAQLALLQAEGAKADPAEQMVLQTVLQLAPMGEVAALRTTILMQTVVREPRASCT